MLTFKIIEDKSDNTIYLVNHLNWISLESFSELTGTKIDLIKRIGRIIFTNRQNGHLYIYDSEFIKEEKYLVNGQVYKCEHINTNGTALLSNNKNMKTITSSEPLAFRVVP